MGAPAARIVLLVIVVTGLLAPADVSSLAAESQKPNRGCARVSFDYSLARVVAGDLMDMDLGILNCSDHVERLRLHVKATGPCAFLHPHAHTYPLPANFAVGSTSLMLAPSCPGRYSVHLRLTLAGHRPVLDAASDGFSVRREGGVPTTP